MKRIFTIFILLALSFAGYSQEYAPQGGGGGNHGEQAEMGSGFTPDFAKYMPTVTPSFPSPQAEAFQIFGQIPVSLYTGTPDISIPLYTLTEGDISVPITLAYHPAGRKVNSLPSWVGLGWNLNVGGVITRIVRGSRDESNRAIGSSYGVSNWISWGLTGVQYEEDQSASYPKGYMYNRERWNPSEIQAHIASGTNVVDGRMPEPPGMSFDWTMDESEYRNCYCFCEELCPCRTGHNNNNYGPFTFLDHLPDKFVFNFMGYSGSFWWEDGAFKVSSDANIEIEFYKDRDITIDLNFNDIDDFSKNYCAGEEQCEQHIIHFKLKTPDGFEYDFGGDSKSFEYSTPVSGTADDMVVSAWYLTKITSPKGYVVTFNYERGNSIYNVYPHFEYIRYKDAIDCDSMRIPSPLGKKEIAGQYISPVYLKSIKSSLYKVDFIKTDADVIGYQVPENNNSPFYNAGNINNTNNQFKLEKINISYISNGHLKKFKQFDFGYIENTSERLKLETMQEKGIINNIVNDSKGSYHFSYNANKLPAPFRESDHWGYANYASSSNTYVLSFNLTDSPVKNPTNDSALFLAEILQKIEYPTGGYTEFQYEPHKYSLRFIPSSGELKPENDIAGGVRIKSIKSFDGISTKATSTKEYFYTKSIDNLSGNSGGILSGLPTYEFVFALSNNGPFEPDSSDNPNDPEGNGTTTPAEPEEPDEPDVPGINPIDHHNYCAFAAVKHQQTGQEEWAPAYIEPGYPQKALNSGGILPMGDAAAGSHIGYSNVIEVDKDENGNIIGYTSKRFTNYDEDLDGKKHSDDVSLYFLSVYAQVSCVSGSINFERGKLILQEKFNSQKKIIEKQRTDYQTYDRYYIPYTSYDFMPTITFKGFVILPGIVQDCYGNYRPEKTTTTKYFYTNDNQTDSIENVVEMTYYDNLIASTKSVLCSGDTIKTEISYLGNANAMSTEITIKTLPVEVRQSINGKTQFGMIRVYDTVNCHLLYPKYDYILEAAQPMLNLPAYSDCQPVNQNFSKIFEYNANDTGNIISAKNREGVVTNFTWGHNNTRPMSSSTNGFNTFYEYQMPFGIKKITAPDGTKTHFEYDGLGRLVLIKDDDENPVEGYEYHYANSDENFNYLKKTVFLTASSPSSGEQNNVPINQNLLRRISFQYCDGLGREIQTVEKAASPLMNDIVMFRNYNSFGKEDRMFLPFPKTDENNGEFLPFEDAFNQARDYYADKYGDTNFFAEIEYERSPLFRILRQGKPGEEYKLSANHTTKITEGVGNAGTNDLHHICHLKWTDNGILKKTNYNTQPYYKQITDPDGHILIQFFEND
ncbi:MAG: RHS repeat protein, partial [Bacteroidales bacterium]|nr:RHS repeat protein [Bacteroidales bacterium]